MQRFWYLSHDAKQSRTKEFYDFWHKHAPYSHRCLRASLRLLEQYQKEKLWEKVIAYGSESIKIIDHNSLSPCGGCEPVMPPMKRRLACCKAIAEACINLGKISEAKDWLAQALADRAYKTDADVLFTLAELAAICQEKDLAIELCKQAMSFKSDDLNAEFNTIRAQTIFKKIGDTADANSMAEQSWSFVLRRMSKDRRQYLMQKQETDKLHKANQENSAKPPDSSANQKWKAEPSKALTFPPVQVLNDYSFKYALLASAITIGSGSQVMRSDQQNPMPTYAFAAAWKTIECAQPVHKAGDLYFLYDGPPGSLLTPAEQAAGMQGRQSGGGGLWMAPFTAPPSAQSLPLKAAPDAPAGAATPDLSNADVILKPGDYKAETLTVGSIIIPTSGRVRLFINDKNSMQTPVFRTNAASGINYSMIGPFFFSPSRFELWYNGTGTIRLDNDCLFAGIIYAPNARVEMGDRVRLYGAVVAKEIITGRDCKIMYDLRLNSWNDN